METLGFDWVARTQGLGLDLIVRKYMMKFGDGGRNFYRVGDSHKHYININSALINNSNKHNYIN